MQFELTDDSPVITLRNDLRPGDIGEIVRLHGTLYAREYGFDITFEAYVAGPLAEFALRRDGRERIWIAERSGDGGMRVVGCIAIVGASEREAQLRWFLVDPSARGHGLGMQLLRAAVSFCRESGYATIMLFTVDRLAAATKLYRALGFELVQEKPGRCWGVALREQRYELKLAPME